MKNALKMMTLLFSFSLAAENAVESSAITPISNETSSNISQENEDHSKSKIEKIINFLDDPDNILAIPVATVGALQALDLIGIIAHECGHALPSAITGKPYNIKITGPRDLIFPFSGSTTLETPTSLITMILGPTAGVSTTYLQCAVLKALHDGHKENKPFAETFKQALKFPITFFTNTMNACEKRCSSWLNKEPLQSNQEETTHSSFMVNTIIFFRTMHMIAESIYGFLPYEMGNEMKGDGEIIWQMLLGKQSPTLKINLGRATIAIMATPIAIGAMKAVYKKVFGKSDQLEVKDPSNSENITQPA